MILNNKTLFANKGYNLNINDISIFLEDVCSSLYYKDQKKKSFHHTSLQIFNNFKSLFTYQMQVLCLYWYCSSAFNCIGLIGGNFKIFFMYLLPVTFHFCHFLLDIFIFPKDFYYFRQCLQFIL